MGKVRIQEYLNTLNLRNARIKRILRSIDRFQKYLIKSNKNLDLAKEEDLDNFLNEYYSKNVSQYYIEDLNYYYLLKHNCNMQDNIEKMKYKYTPPFKLKDFNSIKEENINKLKEIGITTNIQLLNVSKTISERKNISNKTNIPLDEIDKITKMSDLTRITAVKSVRAQLYFEAGINTVEKIAALEPTELRNVVLDYVEKNNFHGVATLPKEAEFTINFARKLPIIVKF